MIDAPAKGVSVRRAQIQDVAAILALTRAAYAKWVPVVGREPLPMTADYDLAVREHAIDLLYADGRMVGLIEMAPKHDHLFIVNVAVAPDHQGRGYGRRLLTHADALALSLGFEEVRLQTNKRFLANVDLYRSLGYAVDREAPFLGGRTLFMSKKLLPA